jgi:hypothetical protein
VEGAAAIGDGAADGGVGAVRGDDAFEHGAETLGAFADGGKHGGPGFFLISHSFENHEEEGLDDDGVVEVPVEVRTVAVGAVAHVPGHVLAEGVVDAELVPGFAEGKEGGLDGSAEEEPVALAGKHGAGGAQSVGEELAGGRGELLVEGGRGSEDGDGEEGGVDEGLGFEAEVEVLRRMGIEAEGEAFVDHREVLRAEFAFVSCVGACFEPGSDAAKETADGFEVGGVAAAGLHAGGAFDGHSDFECTFAPCLQQRGGDALHHGEPKVASVWEGCHCRLPGCRHFGEQGRAHAYQAGLQDRTPLHVYPSGRNACGRDHTNG